MSEFPSDVNQRIAEYRKLAGFTQSEAAPLLGMKRNTYARMERHGNPTPEMLKKIAELYNVSVDTILYGDNKLPLTPAEPAYAVFESSKMMPHFIEEMEQGISLTTNEKNCIRVIRLLPKSKQKEVMNYINNLYKDLRK